VTGDIFVGHSGGQQARGELLLPPSLTEIECRNLAVDTAPGWEGGSVMDLGTGSQLQTLTVTKNLWVGGSGPGGILGVPGNVAVTVGLPGTPGSLRVAFGTQYRTGQPLPTNTLALANGSLTGYLDDLQVGVAASYNYGHGMAGILDLSTATVNIGGEPNKLKVETMKIGGTWDYWGVYPYNASSVHGTLRLPPSLTEIVCGTLQIGAIYAGRGILDFGANSQLQAFTVTNGFYMCYDSGYGKIMGLPTPPWTFTIGQPGAPCFMYFGSAYELRPYYNTGNLTLTNATFNAHLTDLELVVHSRSPASISGNSTP